MNQATDRIDASGSVDIFAAALRAVTGTFPPTPEQIEQHKTQKAELEYRATRARLERHDRKMATLKRAAKKVIRGEVDHE